MQEDFRNHHNALRQNRIKIGSFDLKGFSVSGLATYFQLPELDFCADMGECPISAVKLNHVFLTHAHGDHSRCLMRHHSLRKMMGIPKESVYYLSEAIYENACEWIRAEAMFEGVSPHKFQLPKLVPVKPFEKIPLEYRKDLHLEAFPVAHSIHALGCTLFQYKRKLKDEFLNLPAEKIIELRQKNVEITREVYHPLITFTGDSLGETLRTQTHIWKSPVLVTECTFLDEGEEKMAVQKGHTHLSEIIECLEKFGTEIECQKIILTHFSMKYSEKYILDTLKKKIPETFREKVIAFI